MNDFMTCCRFLDHCWGRITCILSLGTYIVYVCLPIYMCLCVYVVTHVCMYVCICVYVCMCTYVCMYVCMNVSHKHTYTHKHVMQLCTSYCLPQIALHSRARMLCILCTNMHRYIHTCISRRYAPPITSLMLCCSYQHTWYICTYIYRYTHVHTYHTAMHRPSPVSKRTTQPC
jgi:hypothetical protein